jgi:hypothetical protein
MTFADIYRLAMKAKEPEQFSLKSELKELVLLLVLENADVSPSGRWNKMITEESDPFFAGQAR